MNLTRLFEMQKVLDERIVREKGIEGRDLLPEKILALQVELGELANEWRGFKFWSERNKPIVKPSNPIEHGNPMLEEYVDCLHFILSIGNDFKFYDGGFYTSHKENVLEQFGYTLRKASDLGLCRSLGNYEMLMCSFVALGDYLGFTWEQIEAAYYAKNEINHERQRSGY